MMGGTALDKDTGYYRTVRLEPHSCDACRDIKRWRKDHPGIYVPQPRKVLVGIGNPQDLRHAHA